ncbi:hypothetical protein Pmani_038424 [Petrolisthes manimaculis]|uniref:Uncharacterized protein n=1 Tax=Petrolisthes manimaculis TaxID=1843537 RepID=A0AAE1NFQ8_9EUCA|nr:hypothetical protein Pmani_038424 [Petrolisthes manimaculis]
MRTRFGFTPPPRMFERVAVTVYVVVVSQASPWRTLGLSVPSTARTAQLITTGYGRVRAAVAGWDECNV